MHEAGIAQELLRSAGQSAAAAGCQVIHRIVVRVGRFSSVVPESLEFAFEALKPGTPAAGACLEIERVPATAWCPACLREFGVDDLPMLCPGCGGAASELRRGFELDLLRIEAE